MRFHFSYLASINFRVDDNPSPNVFYGRSVLEKLGIDIRIENDFLYLTDDEYTLLKLAGNDLLQPKQFLNNYSNQLVELPDNLIIKGNLNLSGKSWINSKCIFPSNLTVAGGSLNLQDKNIKFIPEDLNTLADTMIFVLPDQLNYELVPSEIRRKHNIVEIDW